LASRITERLNEPAAGYVRVLAQKLEAMRAPVSLRRGRQLVRNIVAVHAARFALGEQAPAAEDSAFAALRSSLPHPAMGVRVDDTALLAAHRAAWILAKLPDDDPMAMVLLEQDALERVALAIGFGIDPMEISTLILDALHDFPPWKRHAFAAALFPVVSEGVELSAVAFDALAELAGPALAGRESVTVRYVPGNAHHKAWQTIVDALSRLPAKDLGKDLLHNLAVHLFSVGVDFEPSHLIAFWRQATARIWPASMAPLSTTTA
jgi:hypothetical protein